MSRELHEDDPHPSEFRGLELPNEEEQLLERFDRSMYRLNNANTAATWVSGAYSFARWLNYYYDDEKTLQSASRFDIDEYFEYVPSAWAPNTQSGKFHAVKELYDWMERKGVGNNIAEDFDTETYGIGDGGHLADDGQHKDRRWIPFNEVQLLWQPENIPAPRARNELLFKLMFYTCARPGEIAEATFDPDDPENSDLDREKGRLTLPNFKHGEDESNKTKNCFYPRDRIEPLLSEWLDFQRDTLGPHGEESEYIFLTHQSPKMRGSHISRLVKDAAYNAEINEVEEVDAAGKKRHRITGHTLRHSSITYYANECPEVGLNQIQKQAGHAKIETTMEYVHEDEKRRREAFNRAWA